jgi:hypothetical protein
MWSEVEREVSKQPHNNLASLRAKIREVMAYKDREVVIRAVRGYSLGIEAVWRPVGI